MGRLPGDVRVEASIFVKRAEQDLRDDVAVGGKGLHELHRSRVVAPIGGCERALERLRILARAGERDSWNCRADETCRQGRRRENNGMDFHSRNPRRAVDLCRLAARGGAWANNFKTVAGPRLTESWRRPAPKREPTMSKAKSDAKLRLLKSADLAGPEDVKFA
jgi:hypothetical protein